MALATYVTDVETAMARAKAAAGEKDVLVHGVGTAQAALTAGVLDEIQIHLIPALLGQGRRLFDTSGPTTSSSSSPGFSTAPAPSNSATESSAERWETRRRGDG